MENKVPLQSLVQEYGDGPIYPNGPGDYWGVIYYFLLRGPVDGTWTMRFVGISEAYLYFGKLVF